MQGVWETVRTPVFFSLSLWNWSAEYATYFLESFALYFNIFGSSNTLCARTHAIFVLPLRPTWNMTECNDVTLPANAAGSSGESEREGKRGEGGEWKGVSFLLTCVDEGTCEVTCEVFTRFQGSSSWWVMRLTASCFWQTYNLFSILGFCPKCCHRGGEKKKIVTSVLWHVISLNCISFVYLTCKRGKTTLKHFIGSCFASRDIFLLMARQWIFRCTCLLSGVHYKWCENIITRLATFA